MSRTTSILWNLSAKASVMAAALLVMGCGPSPELAGGARRPKPGCESGEASVGREHAATRGKLAIWIGASLDSMDLRPDQRATTTAIMADLDVKTAPSRAARKRIAAALADEIAAGSLSREQVEARLAELARVDQAAGAALDDAANRLYAALDAKQRKQFLRAMRANWRHSAEDFRGKNDKAKARELIEDLDLTSDQKHAIRAKVREEIKGSMSAAREQRHAARDRIKAAVRAFRSDQFDAAAYSLGKESLAARRSGLAVRLRIATAALPALSAAQRERVAAYIRAHGDNLD
jgi:Spy/CpxP family protein refolding chaperone